MLAGLAPAGMAASFAARSKCEELDVSKSSPLWPSEWTSMGPAATSLGHFRTRAPQQEEPVNSQVWHRARCTLPEDVQYL
jgi:hypothetical protein